MPQLRDASVEGNLVNPGRGFAAVPEVGESLPEVEHDFLVVVVEALPLMAVHQAHFIDGVLVLLEQEQELLFHIVGCFHWFCFALFAPLVAGRIEILHRKAKKHEKTHIFSKNQVEMWVSMGKKGFSEPSKRVDYTSSLA